MDGAPDAALQTGRGNPARFAVPFSVVPIYRIKDRLSDRIPFDLIVDALMTALAEREDYTCLREQRN